MSFSRRESSKISKRLSTLSQKLVSPSSKLSRDTAGSGAYGSLMSEKELSGLVTARDFGEGYLDSDVSSLLEPSGEITYDHIKVGDVLPYGQRLFQGVPGNVVRMKDIGANKRLVLIGCIGSFTPDCWNRHLFKVLKKYEYYKERGTHFICCITTNDTYTHTAWGNFIGAKDKFVMWSDTTGKFTKMIGMDVVVPWLDHSVRTKRFVILADDMVVTKMIVAPDDPRTIKWNCTHLVPVDDDEDELSDV